MWCCEYDNLRMTELWKPSEQRQPKILVDPINLTDQADPTGLTDEIDLVNLVDSDLALALGKRQDVGDLLDLHVVKLTQKQVKIITILILVQM